MYVQLYGKNTYVFYYQHYNNRDIIIGIIWDYADRCE